MSHQRAKPIVQQPAGALTLPAGYPNFLKDVKSRIRSARLKATLSANQELICLYWGIGRDILARQRLEGWGTSVIDRLSADLSREFPDMKGFSARNLIYMKMFARAYAAGSILQRPVAKLPWRHNICILEKIKAADQRLWYAQKAIENGWNRDILVLQIESDLYHRQGKAVTNFKATLPAPQSDLAEQAMKDPYVFDFLAMSEGMRERGLESGLLDQVQRFLIELGVGFAFVGRQVRLEVGGEDYFIDLLFYHLRLRCYVVVELKAGKFKPEYAGKMNFYLSAVDDRLRHEDDKPSIGLILCKAKHRLTAEYALRGISTPIGVADWKAPNMPESLRRSLPSVAELEAELRSAPLRREAH
jgi:predicted nuclease of restriction endonuclease-like (RecB) superfamily